jgi:NADH dehydrogenase
VAQVAMQQGRYVATVIQRRLRGEPPLAFHYRDRGSMATIGRAAAVADLGWIYLSGYLAWLIWLFVHILYLIQFGNRILVLFQWAWNYFTRNRSARLITGKDILPGREANHGSHGEEKQIHHG